MHAPGTDRRSSRPLSALPLSAALDLTRSSYASQGTISLTANEGDDETNFAATICDNVEANAPVTSLDLAGLLDDSGMPYWTLPSCVYNISGTLTSISLRKWLVNGTTSNPDPFTLLGPMGSSATTSLSINTVHFHGPELNSLAQVNWTNLISNHWTSLRTVSLNVMKFNGSLPASIPSTCTIFFSFSASFSGAIPSTLLSGTDNIMMAMGDTELTGGFPDGFFANVAANAYFDITIEKNNYMTGSIGSNFLAGANMTSVRRLMLNLYNNPSLSGTIPTDLWGLPTTCATTYITIDVSNTNISAFSKTFLSTYTFPNLVNFNLRTLNSAIKGDLPSRIMPLSAPNLMVYTFNNDGNLMFQLLSLETLLLGLEDAHLPHP